MSKVMDPLMVDSDISFVSSGRRSTDYCLSGAWNSNIATGGDSFRLSNASEFEVFSPGPTSPLMLEMGEGTNKSVDSNTNDNYNDNTHSFPQDMSFCSSPSETFSWPSHSQTQVCVLPL